MDERYARLSVAVEKGWVTKDEARAEVGLEPLPNGLGEAQDPMELLRATAEARGGPAAGGGPPGQNGRAGEAPQKALEQKALALKATPAMQDLLAGLVGPRLQADLEAHFREQAERVQAAVLKEG
jgi:hypothetical protein